MIRLYSSGSRLGRFVLRFVGTVALALFIALGSLIIGARPAHASGGGGEAYVDTSTRYNTSANYTLLDSPVTNNDPNALIYVTQNQTPGDVWSYDAPHPLGVWYDDAYGEWSIFNEDDATMPAGVSFNVIALPGSYADGSYDTPFVQTATTDNTFGDLTLINNPALNGNPDTSVQVTQNLNPGDNLGVYDSATVGVWYDPYAGEWAIYNVDGSNMPVGASFNVMNNMGVDPMYAFTFTDNNGTGLMTNALLDGNPNALAFITPVWSGSYQSTPFDVAYDDSTGQWGVQNDSPVTTFFVMTAVPT